MPAHRVLWDRVVSFPEPGLLTGATAVGRSLIPRVAIQVRAGLTADCTGLDIDDEEGLLRLLRLAKIGCDGIFKAQMDAVK